MRSSSVLLLLLLLLCLTVPHVLCTLTNSSGNRPDLPNCAWQETDGSGGLAEVGATVTCVQFCSCVLCIRICIVNQAGTLCSILESKLIFATFNFLTGSVMPICRSQI